MWLSIGGIFGAGLLGLLTDWFFMGTFFHDAYMRYPEVWRRPGETNINAIVGAQALGFLTTIAVFALCNFAGVASIAGGLSVALIAWIAGPLPVVVTNGFFVKLDPKITFVHVLGYLVRMGIAGVAAGVVLPLASR